MSIGADPQASLDRALESCSTSVLLNPNLTYPQNLVAIVHIVKGKYEVTRGRDAGPTLERAVSVLDRLIQDQRADIHTYELLGLARYILGLQRIEAGSDPAEALEQGRAAVEKMLEISATEPRAHRMRGALAGLSARRAMKSQAQRQAHADKARTSLSEAVKHSAFLERSVGPRLDEARRLATAL